MAAFKDLTGQRFDRLTVVEQDKTQRTSYWICRCDCGTTKSIGAGNLMSRQVRSCGCLHRETVTAGDMAGQRFGRLTVIERAGTAKDKALWRCRCECGNETVVIGHNLRKGNTKSCGCQRVDSAKLTNRKHGMTGTPIYACWENMKQRCLNPKNNRYEDYGGRGITICPEWIESFEKFYEDVGDIPGPGFTLDRVDNERGYEKSNVRWGSRSEQMKNRRRPRRMTRSQVAALEGEIERLKAIIAGSPTG